MTLPCVLILAFALSLLGCNRKAPAEKIEPPTGLIAAVVTTPPRGSAPPAATPANNAKARPAISIVPEDPNELAEIQDRFLTLIKSAIAKADPALKIPLRSPDGSSTVFLVYTGSFTYDIKRNDSIISPLEGTVSWNVRWWRNGVPTTIPMTLDARYGYQNGQWVLKDLVRKEMNGRTFPADEFLLYFK